MEKIINNPGLQHLVENIFLNMIYPDLMKCKLINQSVTQILDNPMFWITKLIQSGLPKEQQKEWIKAIQLETNSEMKKYIAAYLEWNFKKKNLFDLHLYTKPAVQEDFRRKMQKVIDERRLNNENIEIIKILAPLTDNFNVPDKFGKTPIYKAAQNGHTNIVKILAPLTNNPNIPDKNGKTPMYWAASDGYTEIVKILAPLTDNPNTPNNDGHTPVYKAAFMGHTEIVKILAPLTKNPNAPEKNGKTPIYWAAFKGHTEIVKILAPLTKNPNAPDKNGVTPSEICSNAEIRKILKTINSKKRKSEPSTKPSRKQAKKF